MLPAIMHTHFLWFLYTLFISIPEALLQLLKDVHARCQHMPVSQSAMAIRNITTTYRQSQGQHIHSSWHSLTHLWFTYSKELLNAHGPMITNT